MKKLTFEEIREIIKEYDLYKYLFEEDDYYLEDLIIKGKEDEEIVEKALKEIGFDYRQVDYACNTDEMFVVLYFENSNIYVRDILKEFQTECYNALFTCPPYGGKEHWNENNDEVEKTCDEWIELCLNKFDCQKYLFVVDQTIKYKENIVQCLEKNSHFGNRKEYVILINRG